MMVGCVSHEPDGAEPKPLASLDDACRDGDIAITGNDLLAQLQLPYEVALGLESGSQTSLTLHAAYRGGEILCYPRWHDTAASLSMHVELLFVTADGTFREVMNALLSQPIGTQATLDGWLSIDAMQGTFTPERPASSVEVQGTFAGPATSGSVIWALWSDGELYDEGRVGRWATP